MDYLLIDTPPGTSDEHISMVQFLLQAGPLDGALIVSTPQEISLLDVRKEVREICLSCFEFEERHFPISLYHLSFSSLDYFLTIVLHIDLIMNKHPL